MALLGCLFRFLKRCPAKRRTRWLWNRGENSHGDSFVSYYYLLVKRRFAETTVCQNDFLLKRRFAKTTFCQNDVLLKRRFAKTSFLPKRRVAKMMFCENNVFAKTTFC